MTSDEELVQQVLAAAEGDHRPFEQLVRRHQAAILANCRYLTRSPTDAEDLAQEVFIKVFFKLASFEGRSRFRTWLQRVKINHCLNFQKRRRGKTFLDISQPELEGEALLSVLPTGTAGIEAAQDRGRIRSVLESIPDSLRIPLVLCDVDGLAYQDIADALGLGLSATKMRIARARALFRLRYSGTPDGQATRREAFSEAVPG